MSATEILVVWGSLGLVIISIETVNKFKCTLRCVFKMSVASFKRKNLTLVSIRPPLQSEVEGAFSNLKVREKILNKKKDIF